MADVCISKPEVVIPQPPMEFGLLIDFDLLKAVTSTNTKPEVVFSGRGRHLENGNDIIFLHISELNNYTGNLLTVVLAHCTHS